MLCCYPLWIVLYQGLNIGLYLGQIGHLTVAVVLDMSTVEILDKYFLVDTLLGML